jgi:transcriptional regulator with XRE-family HTH domain
MTDTLAKRVQARLDELGMSARRASLTAGLGPDAVRSILKGRSQSPRAQNLSALATALRCDTKYLLGEVEEPGFPEQWLVSRTTVPVRGEVKHGAWWEGSNIPEGIGVLLIAPVPDYDAFRQYALRMSDQSLEELAPKGSFVHVISAASKRYTFKRHDVVQVIRSRYGQELFEWSMRQVEISETGEISLHTRYRNRELNEQLVCRNRDDDGHRIRFWDDQHSDYIEVAAWAARVYVDLGGAPLFEADHDISHSDLQAMSNKLRTGD